MTRSSTRATGIVGGAVASLMLLGCADADPEAANDPVSPTPVSQEPVSSSPPTPRAPTAVPSVPAEEPRRSYLSIPALGLDSVTVVRYVGTPDDAEGTRIQNAGPTASPRGGGRVGPGEIGNFIITGHRTSHTAPFRYLPDLDVGARVGIRSGQTVFVYRIVGTRWTSFRSPQSLAAQSAAVPGRPGVKATRAMITLSTCATPEDHAVGNFWSDEFDNPEHRIDKIGVLVETRPVSA